MSEARVAVKPAPPSPPSRRSRYAGWAIWMLNSITPKRSDRAILYGHPPLNDSLLEVLEQLRERGVTCDIIVDDHRRYELIQEEAQRRGVRRVFRRHQPAAMLSYARARYVFVTSSFYESRPVRRQQLINLWHGAFTKRIDSRPVLVGVRGARTTATSRLGAAFRSVEFEVEPEDVLVVGSPRNDRLVRADRRQCRAKFDLPTDGVVLLWMPTYRGRPFQRQLPPAPTDDDLAVIEPWLASHNAILIVKHHPNAPAAAPSAHPHVRVIPHIYDGSELSVAELMAASDGLVTDFSSAWADYLLIDRPIWIHWPDHAEWTDVDNIPLTPIEKWLPGPLTTSTDQLLQNLIAHFDNANDPWAERRAWLKAVFHQYADANSTTRLLDTLGVPASSTSA